MSSTAEAAARTAQRLGRAPLVDTVGWASWAEEAATALCVHSRHPSAQPCRPCRLAMREYLRAEESTHA